MITKSDLVFLREFAKREYDRRQTLERIRETVDVHSPQFDKIMASGGEERDRMAEYVVRIDEAERRMTMESAEDKARYARICAEIYMLPAKELQVVRMRYIECHSWGWIRRHTHYSEREVFYIHRNALKILEGLQ